MKSLLLRIKKWKKVFFFFGKCYFLLVVLWKFIHFASAFIAIIFSQLMASSSALWRLNKPPSSFVSGHKSTMCSVTWD